MKNERWYRNNLVFFITKCHHATNVLNSSKHTVGWVKKVPCIRISRQKKKIWDKLSILKLTPKELSVSKHVRSWKEFSRARGIWFDDDGRANREKERRGAWRILSHPINNGRVAASASIRCVPGDIRVTKSKSAGSVRRIQERGNRLASIERPDSAAGQPGQPDFVHRRPYSLTQFPRSRQGLLGIYDRENGASVSGWRKGRPFTVNPPPTTPFVLRPTLVFTYFNLDDVFVSTRPRIVLRAMIKLLLLFFLLFNHLRLTTDSRTITSDRTSYDDDSSLSSSFELVAMLPLDRDCQEITSLSFTSFLSIFLSINI